MISCFLFIPFGVWVPRAEIQYASLFRSFLLWPLPSLGGVNLFNALDEHGIFITSMNISKVV